MIKFFRNIRQRLIKEGKTANYLKYAIGEIILVVIGILIAVKINNWNTQQSNKKEERFYLQKLKRNIEQDTIYLNFRKKNINIALEQLDSLRIEINSKELVEFSNPNLIFSLLGVYRFTPETSTFDNLTSSGKLDILNNQTLVDSLFVYYNDLNNYTKQRNEGLDTYTRNTIAPYLMAFDRIDINETNKPLKKPSDYGDDVFIRNGIEIKYLLLNGLLYDYKNVHKRTKNLMQLIDDNL